VRRARLALGAPAIPAPRQARSLPRDRPAIELRGVWFRHAEDMPWVLADYDLSVAIGATHVVRGPSGCGKSTLLRLLAGLVPPERGSVLVGGIDAVAARERVMYLPQRPHLFGGTVLENLRSLSRGASFTRIREAARLTGLEALVASWPMAYETRLPPGGSTLSGGQKQIVFLTACLASEEPIVLLDEAMASMDRLLQSKLARASLFAGRTLVVVQHDAP
jgi:ATP-binding cassette subfamily B protein RaxB